MIQSDFITKPILYTYICVHLYYMRYSIYMVRRDADVMLQSEVNKLMQTGSLCIKVLILLLITHPAVYLNGTCLCIPFSYTLHPTS